MYEGGAEGKCHSINEVISNRWTVEVLVSIYSALCSIPAPLSLNSLLKAVIVIKGLLFPFFSSFTWKTRSMELTGHVTVFLCGNAHIL